MVSQAKIDANRRNAAKSTGPRTAEGKTKVKFNAVTHGLTAATVVLPHEDEQAYLHRLEAWTSELKAPGDFGQYLVERLVKISWQLDRADTFEQAKLTKRIQDAPRLFGAGKSHAEPVETLIARLFGTEPEPTEQEPVPSHGARRKKRAGPGPDDPLAPLLRELESSAEGCRRLLDEWTRIRDWLGQLGPEGIAGSVINTRLGNLVRALGLLGVRVGDPDDAAFAATTAVPLAEPFLCAWQDVKDHALREFLHQGLDEDDDPPPPEGPELVEPEVIASWWAEVGTALGKLAAERCARLNSMLARHEEGEGEARGRLAYEASFDDSAEGERVHRYQARWGRSLLRTLAALEELRDRDRDRPGHQESEEACVGQDSHPVIAFMEETRLESCPTTGGQDVNEAPAESVEAHPVEETETERGQDQIAVDEQSIRREEKWRNKPTAVRRTVVKMEPCALGSIEGKDTMSHSPSVSPAESVPPARVFSRTAAGSGSTCTMFEERACPRGECPPGL